MEIQTLKLRSFKHLGIEALKMMFDRRLNAWHKQCSKRENICSWQFNVNKVLIYMGTMGGER